MVYIKEAEKIGDFLRIINASNAVMYYEDIRIYRDHKNMTNRLNNCEQANIDKVFITSNNQIKDINILKENDMLPSIRNLAKDLRISILTVKKAYDELEQEAYIKTVQGKGTFVTPRNNELIREKQISIIENHIEQIINIGKISNISKNEIIDLFNYLYEEE